MPDLDGEPKPSRRLWICAALIALALHVGGAALAVAHLRTVEPDDALGAPAIEIGLEFSSPQFEPNDLPPGPDSEASAASQARTEQQAEEKQNELPQAVPTESEEPDRVVAPDTANKPEDNTKVAKVETALVDAHVLFTQVHRLVQEGQFGTKALIFKVALYTFIQYPVDTQFQHKA